MFEAFKEEAIIRKVGGRFKLSALIQKRMVALNRGARPLVELPTKSLMEIVVHEIMYDKIYLDRIGNVAIVGDGSPDLNLDAIVDDAGPSLEDL